jgi:membrane protease YdiL (CAAX protease family)
MNNKAELFAVTKSRQLAAVSTIGSQHRVRDLLEIATIFALILAAVWTPLGFVNSLFVLMASACVLIFAARARWNAAQMGLTRPAAGSATILAVGILCCGLVAIFGTPLRAAGPGYYLPLVQSAEYGLWAMVQEFILQSVFFLRFEALLGARWAVFASAAVYALAHLPNPILTGLALLGGILFCELFRRFRNLYPVGLIHAVLGLTIAASLPDKWLHHMRVGIGYLR